MSASLLWLNLILWVLVVLGFTRLVVIAARYRRRIQKLEQEIYHAMRKMSDMPAARASQSVNDTYGITDPNYD